MSRSQSTVEQLSQPLPFSHTSYSAQTSSTSFQDSDPLLGSTMQTLSSHPQAERQPQRESLYQQLRWSTAEEPMTRSRKIQMLRSYLPDWVITLVLAGLLAIINKVHGFRREFSLTDTSIQHTYALHERVPVWLLGVLAVLIPAIIIAIISLGVSRSVYDLHNSLLGFILAHALTVTITTIFKVTVGRPRPDLIDRCQPLPNSTNGSPYGLVTDAICSVSPTSSVLRDGFRSFPSGHSSTAWAGFTFLSLYLAAKMHLFDRRGHAVTAWLCLTPLTAAALIAISRTMDYRHHATDVIAGAILGFLIAYWVYRLYYPSLGHPQCHKPYSPRIPNDRIHAANDHVDPEYVSPSNQRFSDYEDVETHTHTYHNGQSSTRQPLNIQDDLSPPNKLTHSLDDPQSQTVPRDA